jgi:hypothetical protein
MTSTVTVFTVSPAAKVSVVGLIAVKSLPAVAVSATEGEMGTLVSVLTGQQAMSAG